MTLRPDVPRPGGFGPASALGGRGPDRRRRPHLGNRERLPAPRRPGPIPWSAGASPGRWTVLCWLAWHRLARRWLAWHRFARHRFPVCRCRGWSRWAIVQVGDPRRPGPRGAGDGPRPLSNFPWGVLFHGEGERRPPPYSWNRGGATGNAGCDLAEQVDLGGRKGTMLPRGEPLEHDGADGDPGQAHDLVSELGQHPADLALLALGQHQLERRRLALGADDPGPLGANLAVGQPDPLDQLTHDFGAGGPCHQSPVRLLDPVSRMSQAVGQLAVVCQDHESGTVLIEPADGVNAFWNFGQEVDHPGPARGILVRRNVTLRLVHGIVNHLLEVDAFAVHRDRRLFRIDPRSQLAHDRAIDRDPPLEDIFLAVTTRAQPRMRQDLLEPLGLAAGQARGRCSEVSFLDRSGLDRERPAACAFARASLAWAWRPSGSGLRPFPGSCPGLGVRRRASLSLRWTTILPAGGVVTSHDELLPD